MTRAGDCRTMALGSVHKMKVEKARKINASRAVMQCAVGKCIGNHKLSGTGVRPQNVTVYFFFSQLSSCQ